jgi:hypothetical protein
MFTPNTKKATVTCESQLIILKFLSVKGMHRERTGERCREKLLASTQLELERFQLTCYSTSLEPAKGRFL